MQIVDAPTVEQFLERHPEATPVLNEAPAQIALFFPDAQLQLRFVEDPEYPEDGQLLLAIRTRLDRETAAQRLRALDHTWWLGQARKTADSLVVDVRRR